MALAPAALAESTRTDSGPAGEGYSAVRLVLPRRFRHYRARRPPWVKLPLAIAEDPRFRALPDATKAHALLLVLHLERTTLWPDHLPDRPNILASIIGATEPVDVDALVRAGVLERCRWLPGATELDSAPARR